MILMHASFLQIEFSRSKLNSHIIVSRTVWRLHLLCTKKPCYSAYSLTFYRRVSRRETEVGWRGERNNYIRCWQQLCVSDNSRKWYWWAVTLSDNSRGIMLPSLSVVFNVGCSNYRCSVVWEQSVTKSLGGWELRPRHQVIEFGPQQQNWYEMIISVSRRT